MVASMPTCDHSLCWVHARSIADTSFVTQGIHMMSSMSHNQERTLTGRNIVPAPGAGWACWAMRRSLHGLPRPCVSIISCRHVSAKSMV